eukprot:40224-Prymnesium_polylepis.1
MGESCGLRSAAPPEPVDLVLLEFGINGAMMLDLLLAQLRRRYPDALFVYVHHFSFSMDFGLRATLDWSLYSPSATLQALWKQHLPPQDEEDGCSLSAFGVLTLDYMAVHGHDWPLRKWLSKAPALHFSMRHAMRDFRMEEARPFLLSN